ncbi:MAG TPA: peptide-methionine (S)-S-oxide reductase MsrA [Methanomassiliicoccales archaeon]|jgi:peptide-methionine (S)-S-oxide reductase
MEEGKELATFGIGCFWCAEATFSGIAGIDSTRVGYMGGAEEDPTYKQVCSGGTGHIEVVEITYDPGRLTYQVLLEIFWSSHNPVAERDGNGDSGSQYRSMIFFHTDEQKALAEDSRRRILSSGRFRGRISTLILPASRFWLAEEHHQCYIRKLESTER